MLQRVIWQETKPAVNLPSRKNAIPLLAVMKHSAVLWWESIKSNTFYMIANSLKREDAITHNSEGLWYFTITNVVILCKYYCFIFNSNKTQNAVDVILI